MTRTVNEYRTLQRDEQGNPAYLLPAKPKIDRIELAAATRKDYTVTVGTKSVVLVYAGCTEPVFARVYTAANLAAPSGDVTDGEAPMIDPPGIWGLATGDVIQFISAATGAVHIYCFA